MSAVDTDRLAAALAAYAPDGDAVLARMDVKCSARRIRRQRLTAVAAVAAVAVLVTGGVLWWPRSDGTPRPDPAAVAPGQPDDGCAVIPLPEVIASAEAAGSSIILATGTLTGRSIQNGLIYDEMVLSSVRTLAGSPVAAGSHAWVSGQLGPSGPVPGADAGSLWAPDGRLFAITSPGPGGVSAGPLLRVAPVVADQVILSSAGCWDAGRLPVRPYTGRLSEIPGSDSYARARPHGFHGVALKTVQTLATTR